jgi:Acetyltransferase (GNAT) family
MFDLPRGAGSCSRFSAEIPSLKEPWSIGAIVGPSGSGKTTIARKAFGDRMVERWNWPENASILDGFPSQMEIADITRLLGSVGFNTPPAWLRPFHLLSNGEQFRVNLARALAQLTPGDSQLHLAPGESPGVNCNGVNCVVIDEFTSVVDRTVARIGSCAIARAVRATNRRFVAVSCHYDILPWLEPDWVVDMPGGSLSRTSVSSAEPRRLRRPPIKLEIVRTDSSAWKIFSRHHYLTGEIHPSAQCFVGLVEGRPAAFVAALPFPHPVRPGWREHRCVCLPDFQGVGIGNAMSEFVASLFAATGKPYRSVTSHPAMIHHRAESKNWIMTRRPSKTRPGPLGRKLGWLDNTVSQKRMTASFEYVGKPKRQIARAFGVGAAQHSQSGRNDSPVGDERRHRSGPVRIPAHGRIKFGAEIRRHARPGASLAANCAP